MAQAGTIFLGVNSPGDTSLHPVFGLLENDTGEDSLLLENRYAGPLVFQWASRQTGGQGFGPTWHVPGLSRVVLPWHPDYDAYWRVGGNTGFQSSSGGDGIPVVTYFHTQLQQAGARYFQRSQLKWLFSSGLAPGQWELYPRHTWTWVTSRVNAMAQGGNLITHYVPTDPTVPSIGGQTMRPLFSTPNQFFPAAGRSQADWRIMAFRVHAMGGSASPDQLEATAFWDLNSSSESMGSSIQVFGGDSYPSATATLAFVDSPMGSALFDVPGAVAVTYDLDNQANALTATFCVDYYCACPLD